MAAATAADLAPVGSEFQVNGYTTGTQVLAAAAALPDGGFVIVWAGAGGADDDGIHMRRYDGAANPVGVEMLVNTYTTSTQIEPEVAADPSGNFIVVWHSFHDGDQNGIFAQRFGSTGLPLGTEFQVNSYTTGIQSHPAVAAAAGGSFLIVWQSEAAQDGDSYGVFGQLFDSVGNSTGGELQLNAYTTGIQNGAQAAAEANGDFLIVWSSQFQDGNAHGVFGRRLSSSGMLLGSEIQINTHTTGEQRHAAVALGASDGFVVWESAGQDGSAEGIFAQRLDAAAIPQGTELQVNTYTSNRQSEAEVVAAAGGGFLVLWSSQTQDGDEDGVYVRLYDAAGNPRGGEFQANSYTTEGQQDPHAVALPSGEFLVVWQSFGQDGDAGAIVAQRLLAVDEWISQTGGPPLTVKTDGESDGATAADPVESAVTSPNAGTIGIFERPISMTAPGGFTFFGQEVRIDAPAATPSSPLVLVFELDVSLIPTGQNPTTVGVFRDGIALPTCTGPAGVAYPDPCVSSRVIQGDLDVQLTVFTSLASDWNFGVPALMLDNYKCYQGTDLKNPKFAKTMVATTDQVGSGTIDVLKVKFVCTPVDMNGEAVNEPSAHLTCYLVKGEQLSPPPHMEVNTQVQLSQFELQKPKLICVPSANNLLP
jgi:hypothetical protein